MGMKYLFFLFSNSSDLLKHTELFKVGNSKLVLTGSLDLAGIPKYFFFFEGQEPLFPYPSNTQLQISWTASLLDSVGKIKPHKF